MTEQERLRRIGELICRAIMRSPELPVATAVRPVGAPYPRGQPEEGIVNYLRCFGQASPTEMRLAMGLSKSMAARSLQRLLETKRVIVSGRTRAAFYRLTDFDPSRN
jgi:hypothetical protein